MQTNTAIPQDYASLRHANNNECVRYDELREGDKAWIEGELFAVTNIVTYTDDRGRLVIRFTGVGVKGYNKYIGTHFDGGTYGAGADQKATIVKRALAEQQ